MTEETPDRKSRVGIWAAIALIVVVGGCYALANSGGNAWSVCENAIAAQVAGNVDYEATGVSWEDQDQGVEVARGHFEVDGDRFSFECAVKDGEELEWLDLNLA